MSTEPGVTLSITECVLTHHPKNTSHLLIDKFLSVRMKRRNEALSLILGGPPNCQLATMGEEISVNGAKGLSLTKVTKLVSPSLSFPSHVCSSGNE